MRWWPFKRKAPHPEGSENGSAARQARVEAELKLDLAKQRQREVDEVVTLSEELLRTNSFGEQVRRAFRRPA